MRVTLVTGLLVLALPAALLIGAERDSRLPDAVKSGDKAAVSALLRQRIDVNLAEADGTTALHWAVQQDDPGLAEQLIRAGADTNRANRYGITPLYLATLNGS